jgi:hypothetical protein
MIYPAPFFYILSRYQPEQINLTNTGNVEASRDINPSTLFTSTTPAAWEHFWFEMTLYQVR